MIEIIPAIDLIGGRCVRLREGDFASVKIYDADPIESAKQFEAAGLRRLHIVDLDGAKVGTPANMSVLEAIATATELDIDYGGGIKRTEDAAAVFEAGASMISVGSVAVNSPETVEEWTERFGSERIFLGADARDGRIAIDGWKTDTEHDAVEFIRHWSKRGISHVFVTDISKDGKLEGPGFELYERVLGECPNVDLVASGGVSGIEDIERLDQLGCAGVIVGKALYEGRIRLADLTKYAR